MEKQISATAKRLEREQKQNFVSMRTAKLTAAAGKAGVNCEMCGTWDAIWFFTAPLHKNQAFPLDPKAEKKRRRKKNQLLGNMQQLWTAQ